MIREMLSEIFSSSLSFWDRCLAAMMALLLLAALVAVGIVAFIAIDTVHITPTKDSVTVVDSKEVVPAHTTTTYVLAGKVMVPVTTPHPESYHLHFNIEGEELDSAVDKEFFDNLSVGDKIEVGYGKTRLSGSYEVANIRST